jgi:alcohol dehydrogenase class IV
MERARVPRTRAMSQSAGGVHDCPHGALTARVLVPVCRYNVGCA